MIKLLITLLVGMFFFANFAVVSAQGQLKSEWFSTHASVYHIYNQEIKNYPVSKYSKDRKNTFAYRFMTGLVQLGYDTTWENGTDMFQLFQTQFSLSNSSGIITPTDIDYLDKKLISQEQVILKNIEKTLEIYPNLQLDLPSRCGFEPLLYYVSLLSETENVFNLDQRNSLKNLVFRCGEAGPRGWGGGGTIIIQTSHLMSKKKFLSLFTHEMGHVLDSKIGPSGYSGKKSIYSDSLETIDPADPSIGFYQISWANGFQRKKWSKREDFVSGYAMVNNPFEDFAETVTTYIYKAKNFRYSAKTNQALKAKYDFMKSIVFHEKEFHSGTDSKLEIVYDATE